MPFNPGYKAYIGLDNAAGVVQDVSAFHDNFDFPQGVDVLVYDAFGSAVKRRGPGLSGGDVVSLSGPLDVTLHSQIAAMLGTQAASPGSTFSLLFGPGGSVSGQVKQSAEVFISNYTTRSTTSGRSEFACQLQVDAAVSNSTW